MSLLVLAPLAGATTVTPGEMTELNRWVAAKLEGQAARVQPDPGLKVLANHDSVIRNNRGGRPLRLGTTEFTRGLFCHAVSKVAVRLPGPGKTFTASVGVDSNEQTSGGRGSVIFTVRIGDKETFRSSILHEGMPAVPVTVELGGATEFLLEVGDAGDGISCDQSDWADAKVVLADGSTVWLGELPILDEQAGFSTEPPFSFICGGKLSAELLTSWPVTRKVTPRDANRTEHLLTWTDSASGLELRCVAVVYRDFPTVEWTLYFKNNGKSDSAMLEQIQALDMFFPPTPGNMWLHHFGGSTCAATDYQPMQTEMRPNMKFRLASRGGRGTDPVMPNFNLARPDGGTIAVLGWPGQWAAQFNRDEKGPLRISGGQELTHFILHPGEEVRSPLAVLQFYSGDWIRGQNIWRRWMWDHNIPRPDGKRFPNTLMACSSGEFAEMINANEANQIMFIDRFVAEKIPIEYWWMDAGWYPNTTGWPNVGTWEVDTKRFPHGLRGITDHLHAIGLKSIVWFEPERVTPGTWLFEKHPEWLLGKEGPNRLLDLGNDAARQWLTDHIDQFLTAQGVDFYRQDFNFEPLPFWRANDTPARQGITEIKHITGYLAYWDELLRRRPGLRIDTCSSGGRRNDLETLRRSVPLLRSDFQGDRGAGPQQCHTYGIAFWIPFFGTGMGATDEYAFRSAMCPHNTTGCDMRVKEHDFNLMRRLFAERAKVVPNWYGDYYPLSAYTLAEDAWMAWQLDRPEEGEGAVQVFKRSESPYETARYKLRGLDEAARYRITNIDDPTPVEMSGRELMTKGLEVTLAKPGSAAIFLYAKVTKTAK